MKFKFLLVLVLLFLASRVEASSLIGHSLRMMKTAGFWISRHPSPDAVIMGPETIDRFNARLCKNNKLTKDIFTLTQDLKTEPLLEGLKKTFSDIEAKGYYTAAGVRNDKNFMADVKRNMNLSAVAIGMVPRYGLVAHWTSQRFLPTREGLYQKKDDYDFDQLQNSALDVGTPAALVHTSADGRWYYVMTAISDGWVEAKDIALGDINQVRKFAKGKDFVVVIRPKADIFMNEAMTEYDDYVRMGMRLPLAGIRAGRVRVCVPVRDADGTLAVKEAYMNTEDVSPGFLSFTARNIYKQALMMLDQPYGWGDMYGEQDCSRFLQMVFATVGINLPRDSKDQAKVSDSAVDFDGKSDDAAKIAAIDLAPAANTLLVMKGHIMLYLGTVNGKPYAIHDTTVLSLDRVIVSDLSLGQGTPKGSLLRRLTRVVTIE